MEKAVRSWATKIARAMGYDAEKEAVIAYGLIAITQIVVTLVLVFLLGLIVRAPAEALIVCLSVSILRKYSGGVHADSIEFCTVFSVIYCTLTAVLSKWLAAFYHPVLMLLAVAAVYLSAFYFAYRYVPVDSPNKPIKSAQKIRRMRKGSFVILAVYAGLSAAFYLLGFQATVFQSCGISLLFGVSWQVLTLTPLGSILLKGRNVQPKYDGKEKTQ